MASQDDGNGMGLRDGKRQYPDYEKDVEIFHDFLLEHQIRRIVRDDDDDDDDDSNGGNAGGRRTGHRMLEPTDGTVDVERVDCYRRLFQRIVDRDYGTDEKATTFLVEIPLSELVDWDNGKGFELAKRASQNTLRYHALFSAVIDQILKDTPVSSHAIENRRGQASLLRDTIDVLHEQRLAQQQHQQQNNNDEDGNGNAIMPMGGVAEEAAGQNGNNNNNNNNNGITEAIPPLLLRRYELRILPLGRRGILFPFVDQYLPKGIAAASVPRGLSLRHVRSKSMGRLVTITGMIVRASDVKPFCHVATYSCDACGIELYQILNAKREFMPQRVCPVCAQNNRRQQSSLQLQTRGSKFVKFQELKLQELPSQVPMGHIPRSLSVYCRGELTRLANPGDVITVDGVFLPQRLGGESGYRAMKAGLMATLFLEAQHIHVHKKTFDESLLDTLSEEECAQIDNDIGRVATSEDPIGILSGSIAPEIFGHEDIKRALLLQLTSGVTRKLPDGMKIRGDINICLMGDPGVAKSQLLKHVASVTPRGVYTTGKGSSGVGLTAAVTKDTMTGELSLEGGALVLADRGICAIDEFDKMDESDRTAIHEVMEQQTVSIAKAGIVATLNARAAVLAAANPLYSRYNRRKSLSENINLPNSLLSRFDLMFLILDTPDVEKDMALARHVTFVHQNEGLEQRKDDDEDDGDDDNDDDDGDNNNDGNDDDESGGNNSGTGNQNGTRTTTTTDNNLSSDFDEEKRTVSPRLLREYISRARRHQPVVPPEVSPYVVEAYVSLRMQDRPTRQSYNGSGGRSINNSNRTSDQTVMTARQLLSILRLSQALARLRFSDFVAREDVDEAIRLTHMSKASLIEQGGNDDETGRYGSYGRNQQQQQRRGEDVMSRIFNTIRDYASTSQSSTVEMKLCEAMILRKGFTVQQLQSCLEEYEALEIIQVNTNRTQIHFLT